MFIIIMLIYGIDRVIVGWIGWIAWLGRLAYNGKPDDFGSSPGEL